MSKFLTVLNLLRNLLAIPVTLVVMLGAVAAILWALGLYFQPWAWPWRVLALAGWCLYLGLGVYLYFGFRVLQVGNGKRRQVWFWVASAVFNLVHGVLVAYFGPGLRALAEVPDLWQPLFAYYVGMTAFFIACAWGEARIRL
jgi:hypothetical protein